MKQLTMEQLAAARNYLLHTARPLEAARYHYHFAGGDAGEVMAALAPFRTDSGGYGHALEPDLRTPAPSALATSVALQIAEEVAAPASHPAVAGAIDYLLATFDSSTARWRIIPPEAETAPHAFWWAADGLDERFGHFWMNPRAELLGCLWRYAEPERVPWLHATTEALLAELAEVHEPLAGNDLLCAMRLATTPQVPAVLRDPLLARVRADMLRSVETDPARWGDYVLRPLEVAPAPDSPFADLFPDAIQANLDYLVEMQGDDGAWAPVWSWAPLDAAAWAQAEREWKGVLTLAALRELAAWGRIER
ncbi:MAG TPA: hypothetical protein P5333_15870 [Caldilinea sp.]|nr:hypothetical protein [Caldilinea sp.]